MQTNPYDRRRNSADACWEIVDTRTDAIVDFIWVVESWGAAGVAAIDRCDELWHAELLRQPEQPAEVNGLGEPMPASEEEALARQLVAELNDYAALGLPCDERYDAKSDQVRKLGFEIGPGADGRLCLWRAGVVGPLHSPIRAGRRTSSGRHADAPAPSLEGPRALFAWAGTARQWLRAREAAA